MGETSVLRIENACLRLRLFRKKRALDDFHQIRTLFLCAGEELISSFMFGFLRTDKYGHAVILHRGNLCYSGRGMNGQSPYSAMEVTLVWSPAENSGMRLNDLLTGGEGG